MDLRILFVWIYGLLPFLAFACLSCGFLVQLVHMFVILSCLVFPGVCVRGYSSCYVRVLACFPFFPSVYWVGMCCALP